MTTTWKGWKTRATRVVPSAIHTASPAVTPVAVRQARRTETSLPGAPAQISRSTNSAAA